MTPGATDSGGVATGGEKAVAVRIKGRVQGVAFRDATWREAERLGVRGWVRNEYDGDVTGHFEGPADAVDALVSWCHDGPPAARVTAVAVRDDSHDGETGFRIAW